MHLAEHDAVHAALLARLPDADARLDAAVAELRCALIGREALARLTGCSDGLPIAVFVPPVAGGQDHTFIVSPQEMLAAMCRIADLEAQPQQSATIIPFPTR